MRLHRISSRSLANVITSDCCYLINNTWDDFGFKTMFEVVLFDNDGVRHDLGFVKILKVGMVGGGRVDFAVDLPELDENYCSLGNDRDYYLKLSTVPALSRVSYLESIRDCVYRSEIFRKFEHERGFSSSLLRDVSRRDALVVFPRLLNGDAHLTRYDFAFAYSNDNVFDERLEFAVRPFSKPPSNIHVLIGRNGVGKTRLLAGIADAVTENKAASIGLAGKLIFTHDEQGEFLNLVIVSYSAFDKFDPIPDGTQRT